MQISGVITTWPATVRLFGWKQNWSSGEGDGDEAADAALAVAMPPTMTTVAVMARRRLMPPLRRARQLQAPGFQRQPI